MRCAVRLLCTHLWHTSDYLPRLSKPHLTLEADANLRAHTGEAPEREV